MINKTLFSLIILGFMLNGCVSSFDSQMEARNEMFEKQNTPIRLYKTSSTKSADFYKSDWAGKKGKSIVYASNVLRNDVFKAFKQNCGFNQIDLIETRIVSHDGLVFKEVWVFKDGLSKRKDRTSGLSVVLTQLPNAGGVDMNFFGTCHSAEPFQFIVTK